MKNRRFKRVMLLIAGLFSFLAVRLALIALASGERLSESAAAQLETEIILYTARGVFYDRDLELLTDEEETLLGVFDPFSYDPADNSELFAEALYLQTLNSNLQDKKLSIIPVLKNVDHIAGAATVCTPVRYSASQPATQLIGYLNSSGDGDMGLEYIYNDYLRQNEGKFSLIYRTDALCHPISGLGFELSGSSSVRKDGIVLTLDRAVQTIAEEVADKYIESGAIIVSEIETGDILAMVSRPYYHPYDLAGAIEVEGSMINKCLYSYNAGSAFKLITASAYLEAGGDPEFRYTCNGAIRVGSNVISCHNGKKHGELNMKEALAVSCNGYFITIGERVGGEALRETAVSFGMGESSLLARDYSSQPGNLPTPEELLLPAETANFSMGQGKLLVTPVQFVSMVQTIANGGISVSPTLFKGFIDAEGNMTSDPELERTEKRVISEKTAALLCEYMLNVTRSGTAAAANPSCGAGTKTSTAETGIMKEDGGLVIQGWITGFFPAESPKYAVAILAEDIDYNIPAVSPPFRELAERIASLPD